MNSLNQQNVNVSIGLNQNYLHRFHTHPNKANTIIFSHILCVNYTSTHNIDLNQCFLVPDFKKTFGPNFEKFLVFMESLIQFGEWFFVFLKPFQFQSFYKKMKPNLVLNQIQFHLHYT